MSSAAVPALRPPELSFLREPQDTLILRLVGCWRLEDSLPEPSLVAGELATVPQPRRVTFDTSALEVWDSGLVAFLLRVAELCTQRGVRTDSAELPQGLQRLLALAQAVPIGIGGSRGVPATPLPHHRTCGSASGGSRG